MSATINAHFLSEFQEKKKNYYFKLKSSLNRTHVTRKKKKMSFKNEEIYQKIFIIIFHSLALKAFYLLYFK